MIKKILILVTLLTSNLFSEENNLGLGETKSPLKIYVISDWFCQSCKKVEPQIEEIYNELNTKATFYFIDYPLHKETTNYSPFHLSFIVHEKSHYLKAREALSELTDKNSAPKEQDMAQLAQEKGLKYQALPNEKIKKGMDFFEKVRKKYKVAKTPTIVMVNAQSGEYETLSGSEITLDNVKNEIPKLFEKGKKSKKPWYKFW